MPYVNCLYRNNVFLILIFLLASFCHKNNWLVMILLLLFAVQFIAIFIVLFLYLISVVDPHGDKSNSL
ncbi:MAG: hypothetical protein ACI8Q3_001673 [Marinomonas primoryensis]|jgi:hypothetical protein